MTKDLIRTAVDDSTVSVSNYITYKNDNLGNSILPEMVKRTSLHPSVEGSAGTPEDNVFYSLHNDAGECIYSSPHSAYAINNDDTVIEIPSTALNYEEPVLAAPPYLPGKEPYKANEAPPAPPHVGPGPFNEEEQPPIIPWPPGPPIPVIKDGPGWFFWWIAVPAHPGGRGSGGSIAHTTGRWNFDNYASILVQ